MPIILNLYKHLQMINSFNFRLGTAKHEQIIKSWFEKMSKKGEFNSFGTLLPLRWLPIGTKWLVNIYEDLQIMKFQL